jgi:hypothetical protein
VTVKRPGGGDVGGSDAPSFDDAQEGAVVSEDGGPRQDEAGTLAASLSGLDGARAIFKVEHVISPWSLGGQ